MVLSHSLFIIALSLLMWNNLPTESASDNQKSTNAAFPKNCYEVMKQGNAESGVYVIQRNDGLEVFTVLCNMNKIGGGWTYVLNRFDGSQDFFLNYTDYTRGFGDLGGEFWIGLQYLYELAGSVDNELLVELVDSSNQQGFAVYDTFRIGSETEGYPISALSGYSGNAGDSLAYHLGAKFSTLDRVQDSTTFNCPSAYKGAWWYYSCYRCQLTGLYDTDVLNSGMNWWDFSGGNLKQARMLVRPKIRN